MIKLNDERIKNYECYFGEPAIKFINDDIILDEYEKKVKIDNEIYYRKYLKEQELINELIGSKLAQRINLDTVIYEIGYDKKNDYYSLLSQDFKKENYNYHNALYILNDKSYLSKKFKQLYKSHPTDTYCDISLINNLNEKEKYKFLKMALLDIFMYQSDRHKDNIIFRTNGKTIELEKCFDYEQAFIPKQRYYNPLIYLNYNEKSLYKLINENNKLLKTVKTLADIELEEIFEEIMKEYPIMIDDDVIKSRQQNNNKKLLKQIK